MRARRFVVLGVVSVVACAAVIACGGDEAGVGAQDAGADAADLDTGTATPADAGQDAETVGDGGSNIDLDAGDDDAGPDAAVCNAVANDAPAIVSTCISTLPALGGGAIVAGKYFLTGVAAIGAPMFCQNTFVPTGFKQTVDLTLAGSVATLESVTSVGGLPARHRTSAAVPGAGNTSPATATPICPVAGAAADVRYASVVNGQGKQLLFMLLPYGKGAGIYRLEKQP